MRIASWAAALVLTAAAAPVSAQQPVAFEVASVKLAAPLDPQKIISGEMRVGMHVDPQRVEINSLALADLINIAFKTKSYQVVGPAWLTAGPMNADRFDIRATLPAGATTDQIPEMLQALLVERFKLEFHREERQQDVFALIVGKGGSKLKEAPPPDPSEPKPDAGLPANAPPMTGKIQMSGTPQSGGMVMRAGGSGTVRMNMGQDGTMRMEMERMNLGGFADAITRFLDRPVVDLTELKGDYTIALELSMADIMNVARAQGVAIPAGAGGGPGGAGPASSASEPGGLSIIRSVESLGLKLDARKLPISKVIIDRLEKRPTEN